MAHKRPSSYDTKMLLKVVFDKTAFVQILDYYKFKQKIDETHSKQSKTLKKIHSILLILKISRKIREPKVLRLLLNVCDF